MSITVQEAEQSVFEVSLLDILRFLKSAWKMIAICGLIGISLSIIYLAITPKQYEARVQISMAQIGAVNNSNNNNINPLGINIEEPNLLILRLSSPASFTPEVTSACGMQDQANASVLLSQSNKLTIPKGVANVVELKAFGHSPQLAQDCALAVFNLIKNTQSKIVDPYIEEAKIKLADNEDRLAKAKEMVTKADKSGQAISASYLSTRDEIRFLLDEITALKNIVITNQNRATRMIAPIYASEVPVSPKKRLTIASGLFGGLVLGLFLALGSQIMAKIKSMKEAL